MADEFPTPDLNTLLINLDEVHLGDILTRRDTALTQAIQRELRSGTNDDDGDDQLVIAGFNNFV